MSTISTLRKIATFLTFMFFSTAAYAADGALTLGQYEIPTRVLVALVGCLLVRIYIWTESKNKLVIYNLSITAIAMLGAGVYTFEHGSGLTAAFGTGLGAGAGAVGLVEIAKSNFLTGFKDWLRSYLNKPPSGNGTP
jgi:hypothetical protein